MQCCTFFRTNARLQPRSPEMNNIREQNDDAAFRRVRRKRPSRVRRSCLGFFFFFINESTETLSSSFNYRETVEPYFSSVFVSFIRSFDLAQPRTMLLQHTNTHTPSSNSHHIHIFSAAHCIPSTLHYDVGE